MKTWKVGKLLVAWFNGSDMEPSQGSSDKAGSPHRYACPVGVQRYGKRVYGWINIGRGMLKWGWNP